MPDRAGGRGVPDAADPRGTRRDGPGPALPAEAEIFGVEIGDQGVPQPDRAGAEGDFHVRPDLGHPQGREAEPGSVDMDMVKPGQEIRDHRVAGIGGRSGRCRRRAPAHPGVPPDGVYPSGIEGFSRGPVAIGQAGFAGPAGARAR